MFDRFLCLQKGNLHCDRNVSAKKDREEFCLQGYNTMQFSERQDVNMSPPSSGSKSAALLINSFMQVVFFLAYSSTLKMESYVMGHMEITEENYNVFV
jgi:hypothetical protein